MVDKSKPQSAATVAGPGNDVVVLERTIVHSVMSQPMPDFMKDDAGVGMENMKRDPSRIPRLKLLHGVSVEVTDNDHLRGGYFYYENTKESLGTSFIGVALYHDVQYTLWSPRESSGGRDMLARTYDGEHWDPPNVTFEVQLDKKDGGDIVKWRTADTVRQSKLDRFGTSNPKSSSSLPAATRSVNFILAFPERPDLAPAVLSFQKSSVKFGDELVNKFLEWKGSTSIYGALLRFKSEPSINKRGEKYFTMRAEGVGILSDKALYQDYATKHQEYKAAKLDLTQVDKSAEDETGETSGSAPADKGPIPF